MEKTEYTLQEAADILGWSYERLKTMKRRQQIQTVQIPYGEKRFKDGITLATLEELREEGRKDNYHEMVRILLREMSSGTWNGRPMTDKWVHTIEVYLKRYWSILGVTPSILRVNAENFKKVMTSFAVDRDKKQDFYSTKMHIYKAVTALTKLLIREGYKKKSDLEELRGCLPGKVFELKKDFLDLCDIEQALDFNEGWVFGRGDYDVYAFDILIRLYAFAGLRKMEAANLRLDQVHLDKGYLHVYGKWAKERIVPIFPALAENLDLWVRYRNEYFKEQRIESKLLVPQSDGTILTITSIQTRFQRFKEHIETLKKKRGIKTNADKIAPHVLRRSCATIAAINGMPDTLTQRMLGHKHAATTEGYKMTQDRHLVEWAQTFHFKPENKPVEQAVPEIPQKTAKKELVLDW